MNQQIIVPRIIIPRALRGNIATLGMWGVDHYRGGQLIHTQRQRNLICNQGLNHLLGCLVGGVAAISPWYIAIFEGNYTPLAAVTAASFTADATESTAYDEATRVEYNEAAAAAQSITNSANKARFTISATKTIYGAALLSASAKSAITGTCLAVTRFTLARAVIDNDALDITYTLTAASV